MRRSKQLHDLQIVDLEREAALLRLRRVIAALQGNPAVDAARAAVTEAEHVLHASEHALRQQTLERQALKDHLAEEERKLYSGRIKSPKEVQNLERETAALKRRLGQMDDSALEQMLARDDAAGTLGQAQASLASAEAAAAVELAALRTERAELAAAIRLLDAKRQAMLLSAVPADLALYDRLRRSKSGRAVTELRSDTCAACGIQLPVQDVSRVRSGDDLVQCPGCSRIVYG